MTAAEKWEFISESDYLEGELISEVKHEYIGGVVEAMAGGTVGHNNIVTNCIIALGNALQGSPCRPNNSDTKVRITRVNDTRYYYPDAMVVCESNPQTDTFQDKPKVIFEVLSPSTRRIDGREKLEAYLSIHSLDAYLMVETDSPVVILHQRTADGFERKVITGIDSIISLPTIEIELDLAAIYSNIEFSE